MRKVFWDNPYQTQLNTMIAEVVGQRISVTDTIAFAFSGGQESDKAYINGMPVIQSEIVDNLIYYFLPVMHGLAAEDKVTMTIDWQRRYRLMRLHFAAELILELITSELTIEKIGAHIAEMKARIDFAYHKNISFIFDALLRRYQQIIAQDLPIKTGFSNLETQTRFWEIEGFARVPCGGTHVRSTAEVGLISLKRVNIGKGKERIEITSL
jgi:Ser-tRNA(Ala) deacylase AlaX